MRLRKGGHPRHPCLPQRSSGRPVVALPVKRGLLLFAGLPLAGLLLAGCTGPEPPVTPPDHVHCTDQPYSPMSLFLAEGYTLTNMSGPAGSAPANQGHEAFTQELTRWLSAPLAEGLQLEDNVTVDLHVVIDGANVFAQPGSTMLFIQFGSDRAFVPESVFVPWEPGPESPRSIHVNETLPLPGGGFTLEAGDRFALLVTSLVEGPEGATTVKFGEGSPSGLGFEARCSEAREWIGYDARTPVILPGNQGLFTGGVPPEEGFNRLTVSLEVGPCTDRVTVLLRQKGGAGPHNDMDMYLLDGKGEAIYAATSPSANETMLLWPENLAAFVPPGDYQVRIESYSGLNYTGDLVFRLEEASGHDHEEEPGADAGCA